VRRLGTILRSLEHRALGASQEKESKEGMLSSVQTKVNTAGGNHHTSLRLQAASLLISVHYDLIMNHSRPWQEAALGDAVGWGREDVDVPSCKDLAIMLMIMRLTPRVPGVCCDVQLLQRDDETGRLRAELEALRVSYKQVGGRSSSSAIEARRFVRSTKSFVVHH
jgi:hypothetical protein